VATPIYVQAMPGWLVRVAVIQAEAPRFGLEVGLEQGVLALLKFTAEVLFLRDLAARLRPMAVLAVQLRLRLLVAKAVESVYILVTAEQQVLQERPVLAGA
jgi:hypothetical protein